MPKPSQTINRLHFSDLDPLRFEDLCLNLVARIQDWKELNHFGRKGSDSGVDIHAVQQVDQENRVWYIQCKRYQSIGTSDVKKIIEEAVKVGVPYKLLIIVACDVSRSVYDSCQTISKAVGIIETEIWTSSTIEAKLYKDYKDLLFVYFGVKLERNSKDHAARIKRGLAMEKKFKRDFIRDDLDKNREVWKILPYEPYYKFNFSKIFLFPSYDETYPENIDGKSRWSMAFLYDIYHKGVEIWISAGMGATILMDEKGQWEVLKDRHDKRKDDSKYRVISAEMIGRIPYYNIIDYNLSGDEYYGEPKIYCNYSYDDSPFEDIIYRHQGVAKEKWFPDELDKKKQVERLK